MLLTIFSISTSFVLVVILCQVTLNSQVHGQISTVVSTIATTTLSPNTTPDPNATVCKPEYNCQQCVQVSGAKCYFCNSNATGYGGCQLYPAAQVFPSSSQCPLSQARWGVCWLNFEAMIISMSVIAGVILVAAGCGIYCCCCKNRSRVEVHELRFEREATERQQRHADRRVEREAKMNTIRQKYGLTRDTSNYSRMEDE